MKVVNYSNELRLEPLSMTNLPEFKELLGSNEFGGCFCAVWTSYDETWEKRCGDKSLPNFNITAKNTANGQHIGFLVYQNEEIVGWTGSGPKTAFPLLKEKLGSRLSSFESNKWSLGCIAIKNQYRSKGLAEKIINSVINKACENGAILLEAYPTRPWHEPRSYRGSFKMFERLGFIEKISEPDGDFEILLMEYKIK